jgi:hypothetical protein
MSNQDDRPPPGDPASITLTYQHRHYWWFSADDAPETWHVSADIDDGGPHVGDMDITLVDTYETRDPFALLDGQDAELGHVAGTLFDAGDGRLDSDLDEQLEPIGSRILILHSVSLVPQWRGFGLGALLAGTAIRKLVGAESAVTLCDLGILADQAAEPIAAENPDIGTCSTRMRTSDRRALLQRAVGPMDVVVIGILAEDQP